MTPPVDAIGAAEGGGLIHVAAAALIDDRDRVLLARRPLDAHQGGLWEFPGGKLEAGESVAEALRREGYVATVQEAFDRWIGDACPCNVPHERLAVRDGAALIAAACWFTRCWSSARRRCFSAVVTSSGSEAAGVAAALVANGIKVLVADTRRDGLHDARMKKMSTFFGNPLSEQADRQMDLTGYNWLWALSLNPEANAMACSRLAGTAARTSRIPGARGKQAVRPAPDPYQNPVTGFRVPTARRSVSPSGPNRVSRMASGPLNS